MGLKIKLDKYCPVFIQCGGEKVTIELHRKSSLNSKSLEITAHTEKVDIMNGYSFGRMKQKIAELESEVEGLKAELKS